MDAIAGFVHTASKYCGYFWEVVIVLGILAAFIVVVYLFVKYSPFHTCTECGSWRTMIRTNIRTSLTTITCKNCGHADALPIMRRI